MSVLHEVKRIERCDSMFIAVYQRLAEAAVTEEEKAAAEEFREEYRFISDLALDFAYTKIAYKYDRNFDIKEYIKD